MIIVIVSSFLTLLPTFSNDTIKLCANWYRHQLGCNSNEIMSKQIGLITWKVQPVTVTDTPPGRWSNAIKRNNESKGEWQQQWSWKAVTMLISHRIRDLTKKKQWKCCCSLQFCCGDILLTSSRWLKASSNEPTRIDREREKKRSQGNMSRDRVPSESSVDLPGPGLFLPRERSRRSSCRSVLVCF